MNNTDDKYLIGESEQRKILQDIAAGIWRVELAEGRAPQLYGDAGMLAILGAEPGLNPEQLYAYWHQRIEPAYLDYVDKAVERVLATGQPGEVEYLWNHPQRGKTVVRCDATLANRQESGKLVLLGLYRDITEKIDSHTWSEDDYHIKDIYKLDLCGKYLLRAYEEVFLVDPKTKAIQLIAYRWQHCSQVEDGKSILNIIDKCVVPEDRERVRALFTEEAIAETMARKGPVRVDFKRGCNCGNYRGMQGILRAIRINGADELLFVIRDIQSEYTLKELKEESEDMLYSLLNEKAVIYEYDGETQQLELLKDDESSRGKISVPERMSLAELTQRLCQHYVDASEWERVREFLAPESVGNCMRERSKQSLSLSVDTPRYQFVFVRISIVPSARLRRKAYFMIELMTPRERMFPVLEAYIRDKADYFYCVDLRTKYFFQIIGNKKTFGASPKEGNDYWEQVVWYVDHYVPEEERDYVKEQMSPANILKALENENEFSFTNSFLGRQGEILRKQITYKMIDRARKRVIMQRTDITERYNKERLLEQAKQESVTDPLTRLYNRLGSERLVKKAMQEANAENHAVLMILDLDNFKKINDRFGHPVGDRILCKVALNLRECFRAGDIISRLGGDEFAVFCPKIQDKMGIHPLLERVVNQLNITHEDGKERVTVTASVGAAFYRGQSYEELYQEADIALYRAKKNDGRYALYETENKK